MSKRNESQKKIVIPCSGIGKAFGTVSREATYVLTEELNPREYRTMCLPLLVAGDEEAIKMLHSSEIITIDGCPKQCATVSVKKSGSAIKKEILVAKVLAANRAHKPGTVLDIGEGGRLLAQDIANEITAEEGD
jgi:uncharacterized metal-binding protein